MTGARATPPRIAIAALAATLAVGAPTAVAAASGSKLERGQAIAAAKCGRCHAIGTEGKSPIALAPPFRDLRKRYPVDHLAEALAEGIMTGHPMMPQFVLEPPEIEALLSYIESLASSRKR